MGHGWKITNKTEKYSRKCECGKGEIVTYTIEEECDYPPFDRSSEATENTCPDRCWRSDF